jgi:hypothetical protein
MENFNEFLHANSSQTSLSCLLDSLQNWKKSTLTFKDAVNVVELMAYHIEDLSKQKEEKDKMIKYLRNKLLKK